MHKIAVALLFALACQAAWASPYRTLPRLPVAKVKARAAAVRTAERILARDASAPAVELAAEPPAATSASAPAATGVTTATPTPTPTATATATATANPDPSPTATPVVTPSATPASALLDAAQVIVMPPPAPTRPGDGPLVIEVSPAYDGPAPAREPAPDTTPPATRAPAESVLAAEFVGAPSPTELATIRESRQPDGRTLQLVRARSGALIEILRDAQGQLLSARDGAE